MRSGTTIVVGELGEREDTSMDGLGGSMGWLQWPLPIASFLSQWEGACRAPCVHGTCRGRSGGGEVFGKPVASAVVEELFVLSPCGGIA